MKRSFFKRKNKYRAIKTMADNIMFDSKLEAGHYEDLKLLQSAGEISDLELQHDFVINVNGKQICIYVADFFYYDKKEKRFVISDSKGVETDVFKLKKKLVLALYPEHIFETRTKGKVIRQ